jgi:hypothetical protein
LTLSSVIVVFLIICFRKFLKDEEEERVRLERASHEIHAPLRGIMLRDYVNRIRTTYHDEKKREKLHKIHEAAAKYVSFPFLLFVIYSPVCFCQLL